MFAGAGESRSTYFTDFNRISFELEQFAPKSRESRFGLFGYFLEVAMLTKFKVFAVAAALAAGTSSAAMAEYPCVPGYALYNGVCQPAQAPP